MKFKDGQTEVIVRSPLTPEIIRYYINDGYTIAEIADRYGLTESSVSDYVREVNNMRSN